MDMIERVAAALWDDRHPDTSWDDDEKRDYMGHARAAIEAMREPTKPMVWAAYEEDRTKSAADDSNIDFAANCWRAMIDAALQSASSQSPPLEKAYPL